MTEGISIDHSVCHGKPVIAGTRVLVSTILGALAGGDSQQEVAEDYGITINQISSALEFAAAISSFQTAAHEEAI